ncbi:MAG: hypothetical protein SRB2_04155 [Desulfobacteraceae bacterium Eth-SRB2]|nr:MAG: hypothetical protein SRB2_04155 [Desulfobacteraceae bacterium Eth-SRB2]
MMTKKKEFTERRKHERFKIKNGAIAMIRPLNALGTTQKYCQIINISRGGLSLRYIDRDGESNEPVKLDLLFIQDSICSVCLKYLSLKPVWVFHEPSKTSSKHLKTKQLGLQLGKMTLQQESQFDHFLLKVTYRYQMQIK